MKARSHTRGEHALSLGGCYKHYANVSGGDEAQGGINIYIIEDITYCKGAVYRKEEQERPRIEFTRNGVERERRNQVEADASRHRASQENKAE